MTITFPSTFRPAPGKLAEAEIHFGPEDGLLDGLRLIGFTIWERRTETPDGEPVGESYVHPNLSLTFPSRPWKSPSGMRTFALLRAKESSLSKAEMMRPVWALRETILDRWTATQSTEEFAP